VDGSFKPLSTGAAYQAIDARPTGYPTVDFNGAAIPATDASAGAVQTAIVTTGYGLDYAAQGQGQVQVSTGTPDSYGFYSGDVTLTATPTGGSSFMGWTVNGTPDPETSTVLALTMDGPKTVRALFLPAITVTDTGNSGPGTLRQAITDAASGDYIILPAGQTITLTAILPQITKSLTIQGNGATLTQSGISPGAATQLLYINSTAAEVRVSRLHFKGASTLYYGGAIRNEGGKLTLESCVFSDNQTGSSGEGGGIYTKGTTASVTVLGCTFSGNKAGSFGGGAICIDGGSLTLTGNIFVNNTGSATLPTRCNMVQRASGTLITGGYNVSDKPGGAATAQSGWTFDSTDVPSVTDITFDATFRPSSTATLSIPSLPSGFPTTYFNGTARGANSTPGAMPKN
jgi:hypothetical protein